MDASSSCYNIPCHHLYIPALHYLRTTSKVLLHELVSVVLTHRTARKAIHLIPNIRESLLPSALLCTTFAVLLVETGLLLRDLIEVTIMQVYRTGTLIRSLENNSASLQRPRTLTATQENMVFFIGHKTWFAHAASVGREDLDGLPVYTVFYAEWLINVPILLILAGTCALGRPGPEVAEPLVITNVYMVFAWSANFIPSVPMRYTVVCVPQFAELLLVLSREWRIGSPS